MITAKETQIPLIPWFFGGFFLLTPLFTDSAARVETKTVFFHFREKRKLSENE
jgi:hypothetical protein